MTNDKELRELREKIRLELDNENLAASAARAESETRDVVDTVLAALDIPHAATTGEQETTRAKILTERIMYTLVALRSIAECPAHDVAESMDWVRRHLAENPPVGYVTYGEAQERIAAGASWEDAISLTYVPEDEGVDR